MQRDCFSLLSDDLLVFIFSKLDTFQLYYIALVCRRWNSVVRQQVTRTQKVFLGKSLKHYFQ